MQDAAQQQVPPKAVAAASGWQALPSQQQQQQRSNMAHERPSGLGKGSEPWALSVLRTARTFEQVCCAIIGLRIARATNSCNARWTCLDGCIAAL
jgi:hypothetical protein